MSKCIVTFDIPNGCMVCPFKVLHEKVHIGDFTYKNLYRCTKEPDIDYDENPDFDPYINDYMLKGRPDWCTLRVLTKGEEDKINDILGKDSTHEYYIR